MFNPLDGPSLQGSLTVNTTVVQEVKSGASAMEERQVVTIQPIDGNIYIYFGDGTNTPNSATVIANGFLHYKKSKETYECGKYQQLFILAESGTVSVRFVERG